MCDDLSGFFTFDFKLHFSHFSTEFSTGQPDDNSLRFFFVLVFYTLDPFRRIRCDLGHSRDFFHKFIGWVWHEILSGGGKKKKQQRGRVRWVGNSTISCVLSTSSWKRKKSERNSKIKNREKLENFSIHENEKLEDAGRFLCQISRQIFCRLKFLALLFRSWSP